MPKRKLTVIKQSGAFAYRNEASLGWQVRLITSRRTGCWGIPKGNLESGLSAAESAEQEAHEEAGVLGVVDEKCLGVYHYEKMGRQFQVEVFPLLVEKCLEHWLEKEMRKVEWFSVSEAISLLENQELKMLLSFFSKNVIS